MNTTLTSFSDQPRLKLISRAIEPLSAIPLLSQSTNEIRGVNSSENSGFLRLSAQTPAKSCIDLIGDNTSSTNAIYSNSIRFNTANSERMIINASGNVGIGTNTPGVRLDVVGGQGRVNSGATTSTALTTTGRVGVNNASPGVDLDITGAARVTATSTTTTALTTTGRVGVNNASPGVDLDITGVTRVTATSTTSTALTTTGRVGINQATPTTTLDITGDARVNSGATTSTALTTTGRVGVNNASPSAALDVTGDVKLSSTLTTAGNVGVMTAAPTAPLDVTGNTILRNSVRVGSSSAPTVALDVTGSAIVNSGATTNTALTTTGRVGINQSTPTVPLDVAGAARISGELDMNFSGKIVKLRNPDDGQDAATKGYVDTKTTDMATSSSVSTAITTALGSSGTQENRPTVQRGDTTNDTFYLTYINISDRPSTDGLSKRALLRCDNQLLYNSNNNTLYANIFSGNFHGNDVNASTGTFTGNVGIGTSPSYPLHVNATGVNVNTGNYRFESGGAIATGSASRPVVAGFQGGWIGADTGLIMFSDQRIKSDIINVDIESNLDIFRQIRPVKHGYIDKLEYGNFNKYGFIAQEVRQLLPEAVIEGTQIIPSVYCNANIDNFLLSFNKPIHDIQHFKIGTKLKCYDDKNEIVWVTIKEIINSHNIEIEETITNDMLFVYGHSVNDFLHIDKDAIYTVATAALQEVDRQQQADKVRIAELEATVAAQQSLINDILERLKSNGM